MSRSTDDPHDIVAPMSLGLGYLDDFARLPMSDLVPWDSCHLWLEALGCGHSLNFTLGVPAPALEFSLARQRAEFFGELSLTHDR